MTAPRSTPNPATTGRPERSSTRVARKKPLGWLPWALLALLLLLGLAALLALLAANDNEDAASPAVATRAPAPTASLPTARPSAGPSTGAVPAPTGGAAAGSTPNLAGLSATALVGGGAVAAGPASAQTTALTGTRESGTAGTVLFPQGSAEIDAEGQKVIAAAVTGLRAAGARTVTVNGNTDVIAGDPTNDPLAQQRADAVAAALRTQLPGVTVTTAAFGQDRPIASNDTADGRQQNRRAAIVATG